MTSYVFGCFEMTSIFIMTYHNFVCGEIFEILNSNACVCILNNLQWQWPIRSWRGGRWWHTWQWWVTTTRIILWPPTKRIPPWVVLVRQENHDHNGNDVISSNKQQEEHDHGEKNWPLTFDKNFPPLTPNENLELIKRNFGSILFLWTIRKVFGSTFS